MTIASIFTLLLCHFVGDFIMQPDSIAQNKSKSNAVLADHIALYLVPFLIMFGALALITGAGMGAIRNVTMFVGITGTFHFITDYFTSRYNSKAWAEGRVHDFFVMIGFDQMLHMIQLILTFHLICQ